MNQVQSNSALWNPISYLYLLLPSDGVDWDSGGESGRRALAGREILSVSLPAQGPMGTIGDPREGPWGPLRAKK